MKVYDPRTQAKVAAMANLSSDTTIGYRLGYSNGFDIGYYEGESAERERWRGGRAWEQASAERTAEIVVMLREWAETCDPGSNERNVLSYAAGQLAATFGTEN